MTRSKTKTIAALLLTFGSSAAAQQPPRSDDPARSVTLSLAEYNRLIDLANRPAPGAALAPVAAVVASADLRVRVDRDTARGTFTVNGDVLRAGVSRVSLLSGATLIEASAGGRPLPLIADGNAHTALVPGPGPFSLTLEWGAPLTFGPGRASFVLPVPQAGSARLTVDLPGEQADVRLSAGLVTRRAVAGGRTSVEATLDPGSSTEVSWSMRDSAPSAAAREVRTLADVMTLVTLGDSDVRMVALIDVTVVQGQLRTIPVRLPPGYEVTGISGSSLEMSEPRDGGLVLTFGDLAARSHQVLVSLERPHDGGSFAIETGFVTVPDVQRERGEVAIEGVGTLELAAAEREGMHRIDVKELNRALASIVSVDIAGEPAKPALGADGTRVPLLRPGFRPSGAYQVSFVYIHAGTPFARKGDLQMTLPKMDIPVGIVEWEVFVPEQYSVRAIGGNAIDRRTLHRGVTFDGTGVYGLGAGHESGGLRRSGGVRISMANDALPGQIRGRVTDAAGSVIPGATISLGTVNGGRTVATGADGTFLVQGVPSGEVSVTAELAGFTSQRASFVFDERPRRVDFVLEVGSLTETVTVSADSPSVDTAQKRLAQPSQNVINLQRRASGVLPIRVDVPRAGTSHQFVKPLVVDQETVVKLRYKRR